jgi:hypothetical protein
MFLNFCEKQQAYCMLFILCALHAAQSLYFLEELCEREKTYPSQAHSKHRSSIRLVGQQIRVRTVDWTTKFPTCTVVMPAIPSIHEMTFV